MSETPQETTTSETLARGLNRDDIDLLMTTAEPTVAMFKPSPRAIDFEPQTFTPNNALPLPILDEPAEQRDAEDHAPELDDLDLEPEDLDEEADFDDDGEAFEPFEQEANWVDYWDHPSLEASPSNFAWSREGPKHAPTSSPPGGGFVHAINPPTQISNWPPPSLPVPPPPPSFVPPPPSFVSPPVVPPKTQTSPVQPTPPVQVQQNIPVQAPQINPVQPPQINPAQPPQIIPVQPPQINPVQPQQINPVQPQQINPVQPPQINPVQPPQINPVQPQQINPVQPQQINPVQLPQINPVQPPQINPVQPQQINPVQAPQINPVQAPQQNIPVQVTPQNIPVQVTPQNIPVQVTPQNIPVQGIPQTQSSLAPAPQIVPPIQQPPLMQPPYMPMPSHGMPHAQTPPQQNPSITIAPTIPALAQAPGSQDSLHVDAAPLTNNDVSALQGESEAVPAAAHFAAPPGSLLAELLDAGFNPLVDGIESFGIGEPQVFEGEFEDCLVHADYFSDVDAMSPNPIIATDSPASASSSPSLDEQFVQEAFNSAVKAALLNLKVRRQINLAQLAMKRPERPEEINEFWRLDKQKIDLSKNMHAIEIEIVEVEEKQSKLLSELKTDVTRERYRRGLLRLSQEINDLEKERNSLAAENEMNEVVLKKMSDKLDAIENKWPDAVTQLSAKIFDVFEIFEHTPPSKMDIGSSVRSYFHKKIIRPSYQPSYFTIDTNDVIERFLTNFQKSIDEDATPTEFEPLATSFEAVSRLAYKLRDRRTNWELTQQYVIDTDDKISTIAKALKEKDKERAAFDRALHHETLAIENELTSYAQRLRELRAQKRKHDAKKVLLDERMNQLNKFMDRFDIDLGDFEDKHKAIEEELARINDILLHFGDTDSEISAAFMKNQQMLLHGGCAKMHDVVKETVSLLTAKSY